MRHFMILLVATLVGAACVPIRPIGGSGELVTQEFALTDFERVEIHSAFEVAVHQGDSYEVSVTVDEAVMPYLRVEKQGNTLQIGLTPAVTLMGNLTLRGEVTLPALRELEASGASQVEVTGFSDDDDLAIRASGASTIDGSLDGGDAQIEASGSSQVALHGNLQDVAIEASGASKVTLNGAGRNVTITASGDSPVDLAEFAVQDAEIRASGASQVSVNLSGRLDVDASGASQVTYSGSPTLGNLNTTGASTIERR